MWFGIERKRRFEERIILLYDRATPVRARTNDPLHFACLAENIFSVSRGCVLALVEMAIAGVDLKMAIELGIKDAHRRRYSLEECRSDLRHGAAHVGAREGFVDTGMTFRAGS